MPENTNCQCFKYTNNIQLNSIGMLQFKSLKSRYYKRKHILKFYIFIVHTWYSHLMKILICNKIHNELKNNNSRLQGMDHIDKCSIFNLLIKDFCSHYRSSHNITAREIFNSAWARSSCSVLTLA